MAVDPKFERDHVPPILTKFVTVAKERRLSPSHATRTVVQVIEMPFNLASTLIVDLYGCFLGVNAKDLDVRSNQQHKQLSEYT